jgi:hypothetical protein
MDRNCFSPGFQQRGCRNTQHNTAYSNARLDSSIGSNSSSFAEESFERLRDANLRSALSDRSFGDVVSRIESELNDGANEDPSVINLSVASTSDEIRNSLSDATFVTPIGGDPSGRYQRVFTFSLPSGTERIDFSTFHYGRDSGGLYTGKLSAHFDTNSLRMKLGEQFDIDHKRIGDRDVYTLALRHSYVGGIKISANGKSYILFSHDDVANYEEPKPIASLKTPVALDEDYQSSPSDRVVAEPESPSDHSVSGETTRPRPSVVSPSEAKPMSLDDRPMEDSAQQGNARILAKEGAYSPAPLSRSAPREVESPLPAPHFDPPMSLAAPAKASTLEFSRISRKMPEMEAASIELPRLRRRKMKLNMPELKAPDIPNFSQSTDEARGIRAEPPAIVVSSPMYRGPASIDLPNSPAALDLSHLSEEIAHERRLASSLARTSSLELPAIRRETPKLPRMRLAADFKPATPDIPIVIQDVNIDLARDLDSETKRGPAPLESVALDQKRSASQVLAYSAPNFERSAPSVFHDRELDDLERLAKMCAWICNNMQSESFIYEKRYDHEDLAKLDDEVISNAYKNPYFAFSSIAGARFGLAEGRSVERLNDSLLYIDNCYQGGSKDDWEARYSLYERAAKVDSFITDYEKLAEDEQYLSGDELNYLKEFSERLQGICVYLRKVEPLVNAALSEEGAQPKSQYLEERRKGQRDGIEETLVDAVHASINRMFSEESSIAERIKAGGELARALELNPDGLTYEDAEYLEKTLDLAKETLESDSFIAMIDKQGTIGFDAPLLGDITLNVPSAAFIGTQYALVLGVFERFNERLPTIVEVSSNRDYIDESRVKFYDALDSREYDGRFIQDSDGQYGSPREFALKKFSTEAINRINLEIYRISNLIEEEEDSPLQSYHEMRLRQLARQKNEISKAAAFHRE